MTQGDIINHKRLGATLEFIKDKQAEYDEAIQDSTSCPSSMHRGGVSKATLRKNTSIKCLLSNLGLRACSSIRLPELLAAFYSASCPPLACPCFPAAASFLYCSGVISFIDDRNATISQICSSLL